MADVSAAAAALGIPEALVERSVEARAAASGTSVDDLLAAWAGGEAAPEPAAEEETPAAEPEETAEPAADEVAEEQTPERAEATPPEIVVDVPGEPETAPAPTPSGPYETPVLVGAKDNPMMVFAGAIFLFLMIAMVGLVGPSIPFDEPGARTSDIDFSPTAVEGRDLYLSIGCSSCHTQLVRPVIADVGLGPVTLDDTDQVLGTRRFGPDLADVGSRLTASQIEATIGGLGAHPAHDLAAEDLESLVAYLAESARSQPEEAES